MRHFGGGGFVIAGQGVEAQVDAGRQHQAVVGEGIAVGQSDNARLRVDFCGGLRNDGHACGGNPVIGELLHRQFPQSRDHFIAERAGGKHLIWLDQRHLQFCIKLPQRPGTTCAAKTAADHDDSGRALRKRRTRQC